MNSRMLSATIMLLSAGLASGLSCYTYCTAKGNSFGLYWLKEHISGWFGVENHSHIVEHHPNGRVPFDANAICDLFPTRSGETPTTVLERAECRPVSPGLVPACWINEVSKGGGLTK